jgi:replicative DNA helicase
MLAEVQKNHGAEEVKFKFDLHFQEKILQAMINDRNWATQFLEVLSVDYFQYNHIKFMAQLYVEHYKKYRDFPSFELYKGIIKDALKDDRESVLLEDIKRFLKDVATKKDLTDLPRVREEALEFCKIIALQKALEKSVDLVKTEKRETIIDLLKAAISAGISDAPGLSLDDDQEIDARYSETHRRVVPTGISELDEKKVLNGGLGAGELGIVAAPTGCGKSHMLVQFGAEALKRGKNVLHYTFELSERMVGIRYDSNLLQIDSLDCFDNKEKIKGYYKENLKTLGRLRIKYYPTSCITVNTIKSHLDKLSHMNFKPDLIIIDYIGIMRSTQKYELLRLELKKVCEEIRALASEMDIPIWTALQTNKAGAEADYVGVTNMAESYSQAHVADIILGLSRKDKAKSTGISNLFIAKNRAGIDGLLYSCHLDTARSTLRVLTPEEKVSYEKSDNDDTLNVIREKFKNITKA